MDITRGDSPSSPRPSGKAIFTGGAALERNPALGLALGCPRQPGRPSSLLAFPLLNARAKRSAGLSRGDGGTPTARHRVSASVAPASPAAAQLAGARESKRPRSNRKRGERLGTRGRIINSLRRVGSPCRCLSATGRRLRVTSMMRGTWSVSDVAMRLRNEERKTSRSSAVKSPA